MKHNWTYKKLGEVTNKCENIRWNTIPQNSSFNYVDLTSVNRETCSIEDTQKISIADAPSRAKQIIHEGDIIFGTTRPLLRRVCRIPKEFDSQICSTGFCVLRPTSQVLTNWIFYNLCADRFYEYVEPLQTGANYPAVSDDVVRKFRLPIPSLSEQESIVAELDAINHLIDLQEQQLCEYDRLAQSLFYSTFGDPVSNPKGWEVKKYGDIFEISSGGTPSKKVSSYWKNGNIPWIGSNMCQNCVIYETDGKYITQEGLNHSSAKLLPKNTVLVALVGATIGKVALLKTESSTNQNIAFIKPHKDFAAYFVYFHLMNQYDEFMNIGNGDFKMATQGFIKGLRIMCPPLSLQQSFAVQVEAIEQQKALIRRSLEHTRTLLAARMQYYFE